MKREITGKWRGTGNGARESPACCIKWPLTFAEARTGEIGGRARGEGCRVIFRLPLFMSPDQVS